MPFVPHHRKNLWPVSDGVTKTCRCCLVDKPVSDFNKMSSGKKGADGFQNFCRSCAHERLRKYRDSADGREVVLKIRHKNTLKTYGLSPSDYAAMFAAQDGRCAICKEPETATRAGRVKNLAVDHDHRTGRVRALLCTCCNQGIGSFRDDPSRLRLALDYIENHRKEG